MYSACKNTIWLECFAGEKTFTVLPAQIFIHKGPGHLTCKCFLVKLLELRNLQKFAWFRCLHIHNYYLTVPTNSHAVSAKLTPQIP